MTGILYFTIVSSKKTIYSGIALQLNFYSLFLNWNEKDTSGIEFSHGAGQGKDENKWENSTFYCS